MFDDNKDSTNEIEKLQTNGVKHIGVIEGDGSKKFENNSDVNKFEYNKKGSSKNTSEQNKSEEGQYLKRNESSEKQNNSEKNIQLNKSSIPIDNDLVDDKGLLRNSRKEEDDEELEEEKKEVPCGDLGNFINGNSSNLINNSNNQLSNIYSSTIRSQGGGDQTVVLSNSNDQGDKIKQKEVEGEKNDNYIKINVLTDGVGSNNNSGGLLENNQSGNTNDATINSEKIKNERNQVSENNETENSLKRDEKETLNVKENKDESVEKDLKDEEKNDGNGCCHCCPCKCKSSCSIF